MESSEPSERARQILGIDRLPHGIESKRLTELVDLKGKRAVVTGAGGVGLGQAIAHRLASQGAVVVATDIDEGGLERVAQDIEARWGTSCVTICGDVTSWDDAHRIVRESVGALGGIDIWINNVGYQIPGEFWELTKDEIDTTINAALVGTLYCTRAILEIMIPQRSGNIINITSEAAKTNFPHVATYKAAKAGVIGFTHAIATDVGRFGIRVNAVSPGNMVNPASRMIFDPDYAEILDHTMNGVSIGRAALPEEVANVVAFLASDASSYVHGAVWSVSGGQSAY